MDVTRHLTQNTSPDRTYGLGPPSGRARHNPAEKQRKIDAHRITRVGSSQPQFPLAGTAATPANCTGDPDRIGWPPMPPALIEVTVFSRQDCHLCHVVLKMARRIQAEVPFLLTPVDIAGDPALEARYGARIPVVLIDRMEKLSGRMTERQLRRAIKWARWTRPISRILSRAGGTPARG
jgi:hypothetical protein